MPLYRVVHPISIGARVVPAGAADRLASLSPRAIDALTRRGAIAPAASPPLAVLPGWVVRSERLAAIGIADAIALIDADPDEVGHKLRRVPETIRRWQAEAMGFLAPPVDRFDGCEGCRRAHRQAMGARGGAM